MDECAVCLSQVRTKASLHVLSKCSHAFHFRCIKKWLGRGLLSCPLCRAPCVAEVKHLRKPLVKKMQAIIDTLPPPPGVYFPSYVISILSSPQVQHALEMDDDTLQAVIDLAYQHHTASAFWKAMKTFDKKKKYSAS